MKKYKGFLAGMLTMLLILAMCGTAFATTGKFQREIEYRDIKVSLDGKILDLKDAKGNTVEPFMFGGTNYIPARALAEALGLQVAWDGSTSTVVLTSPEPANETEAPEPSTENKDELLFSKDQVRIYYTGFQKTDAGYEINLRTENYTGYPISGRLFETSVSGKWVDMALSCKTEPGEKSNGKITISNEQLEKAGITKDVVAVKVRFQMYDTDKDHSLNKPDGVSFMTDTIFIRLK